jgi:hypothetical protein
MFLLPTRLVLCTAALLGAGAAWPSPPPNPPGAWAGRQPQAKAYAGMGTRTTVIPLLSYENRWAGWPGRC